MSIKSILIGIASILVVFYIVAASCGHHDTKQVTAHVAQENQAHGAAVANATQGTAHDQTVEAQKPVIQSDAATVARLQAEVARLRAAAAHPVVPAPVSGVSQPEPAPVPVEPPDLAVAKDQLIDAQTKEIADLNTQVLNLTSARDSWKTAYEDEAKARLQADMALAAQKGVTRAAEIKSFILGMGVGFAVGKTVKF